MCPGDIAAPTNTNVVSTQGAVIAGAAVIPLSNDGQGTVEVLAEGPAEQVNGFLSALKQRMAEYIEEVRVEEESPQGVRGFRVKY